MVLANRSRFIVTAAILAILGLVHAPARAQCLTCPGDLTADDAVAGDDIQGFADCLLDGGPAAGPCACADMNGDALLDAATDIPLFVDALIFNTGPCGLASALTLTPDDPLLGVGRMIDGSVCLDAPAPPGGITVTLTSLDPGIATIMPAMLTIPEGDTCAAVTIFGVSLGMADFTADAPGFAQATASVTVTTAIISLGLDLNLIPGQTAGLPLSLSQPAPAGGVTVTLVSSDPSIADVTPSIFIPAGLQTPAANPQVTGMALGTVEITASTSGFAPDTREVVVGANVITLNPTTLNVVQGQMANMTIQLQVSAPVGGQTIDILIDNLGIATAPLTAFIPQGENSVGVPVTGVSSGATIFRASALADSIPEVSANVNVGPAGINLSGATVGRDLMVSRNGTLTAPAPAGNLLITISSDDPASLLLSNNSADAGSASIMVTVPAGSFTVPTFWVHGLVPSGSAGITATAPGYLPGAATFNFAPSGFIIWSPGVINTVTGLSPTNLQLRPARLNPVTLVSTDFQNLRGGLSADVTILNSVPAVGDMTVNPVPFNGGDLFATSGFEPLAAGSTTLTLLTPPGFDTPADSQSITANVTNQGIVLTNETVGRDLQDLGGGSLTSPAPAGNLNVTITSGDPARVLLSNTAGAAGSPSIIVTVGAGTTSLPSFYVQSLDDNGTVDITATAPGYGPGTATVTLQPSGFIIWSPGVINTVTGVGTTNVQVRPARLNPLTMNYTDTQSVRGGLSVDVDVLSSLPSVGDMTVNPVTFQNGELFELTGFQPLSAGTTTISLVTPPGFDTPAHFQSIVATVSAQGITLTNQTVGDDLQQGMGGQLSSPAPAGNLEVTITSADPSRLLVSNNANTAGAVSTMVTVNAGSTSLPTFYVQALDDAGTVDITATAPGYGPGTATITLQPSGFIIWTPGSFNTTTFAAPTTVQLRSVRLNPTTLNYVTDQPVRAGIAPVGVDVLSSDTNVGVMTTSPVVFNGNQFFVNTSFDPLIAGVTTLSLVTPPDFDTPANFQSIVATVDAPDINISNVTVGEDLQEARAITLQAAPPNPVDVTVTVNDPSIATISSDPLLEGGASVTFFGVTSSTAGTIHVQGRMLGDTTLTVQAAGYNDGFANVMVDPSGFIIWTPGSINTSTFSTPTTVQVRAVRLNPTTLNYVTDQRIRGGLAPVPVDVMSSDPLVGTITTSPLVFGPNEFFENTSFDPSNAGSSTISLATPPGFHTPSNFQQIPATVTAPNINIANVTVGEDLQQSVFVSLTATPPAPVDVTITSGDASVAVISTDPLLAGGVSVTFSGVTTANVGTIYVQGLTQSASTTLTASAAGYNNATPSVSVHPSGFVIWAPSVINTSTYSTDTSVQLRSARLHPTTLNYSTDQPVRGGLSPVAVSLDSSAPAIGTIASPVVFNPNIFFASSAFNPSTVGTTTLSVIQPAGFDAPSNFFQITANVSLPTINLGADMRIGEDLQEQRSIFLQAPPPSPVDVTITSGNPSVAALSSDPLLAGGASVTFFGVSTTSVGTIHVQGLMQGMSTTLTATAAGYAVGTVNVAVDPSGFVIWSPSVINTSVGAAPTSVQIRSARLNPTTLNYSTDQRIRGGFSAAVDVETSNAAVGTITISPLTFNANDFFLNTGFDPVGAGTCNVTVLTAAGFDMPSNNRQISANVSP